MKQATPNQLRRSLVSLFSFDALQGKYESRFCTPYENGYIYVKLIS